MKWTCKSLVKACEQIIQRDDCTLNLKTIDSENEVANVGFKRHPTGGLSHINMIVDPSQSSLVRGFLHEALHIVLIEQIGSRFNETLEEVVVNALEERLWTKTMRRGDVARWRRIINAKLS